MASKNSIWWERVIAIWAVAAVVGSLAISNMSCGGEDLIFSGQFPTETPVQTVTGSPTMTETPDPNEA